MMDSSNSVAGVAAVFRGFRQPVLSLVSDDTKTACSLFSAAQATTELPPLLVLHTDEPYVATFSREARQTDFWMVRETATAKVSRKVCTIDDPQELLTFCDRQGLRFWASPMLSFGHAFGIRVNGELVSAASVNFILEAQGYAQIGSIATDPRHRHRGFATSCIRAVVGSLNRAGIARCGLFADSKDNRLLTFYSKREFHTSGKYCFVGP